MRDYSEENNLIMSLFINLLLKKKKEWEPELEQGNEN